ncbi:MAG: NAD-dependent epimerase/dehydratase family protein [Bacteroidota bacterium]
MNVLVTGATGFIGSHLVERLRREGHAVRCIAKDPLNMSVLEAAGCSVVLGDLNNGIDWEALLDGIDVVYHVAGVTRCRKPEEYYEGNFRATQKFIRACATVCRRLSRFIYVSSLTATGPSIDGLPVTEETPYHPVSHYGKSKMFAELEVLRDSGRVPVTIVRPSAVYGPRERDMFDYIRMIKRRVQLLIGFRQKFLSLIHADDLVSGIILAGQSAAAAGRTYFLGSEEYYSVQQLGATIARVVATHPLRVHLPHALVFAVGAVEAVIGVLTRRQMFFNLEKARESVQPAWICSVAKARSDFGFRQRVSLESGMRTTYEWYLRNGWM